MYINQGGHTLFQPEMGRGAVEFPKGPFLERWYITCGKNAATLKPFLLSYFYFTILFIIIIIIINIIY